MRAELNIEDGEIVVFLSRYRYQKSISLHSKINGKFYAKYWVQDEVSRIKLHAMLTWTNPTIY